MQKRELILIFLILLTFILSIYSYPKLPEKIPTHWNSAGEIDDYGGRNSILIIPFVLLGIYLLFIFIPTISVFKQNVDDFYKKYMFGFKLIMILFLTAIYIFTLLASFNYNIKINYFIFPALGILFYYIGYMIKNAKRNFFIGIRTPWTLANDTVWKKTHLLGGKIFKILGIYTFLFTFFISKYAIWLFVIPLLIAVFYLLIYSFIIFKKEKINKLE